MARSSMYGGYINRIDDLNVGIPRWMTGSDFGDLSQQLNQADRAMWITNSARQQMLRDEMQNEMLQSRMEREQEMDNAFRTEQPTTLKDAYALSLRKSLELGDTEDVMKSLRLSEALNQQQTEEPFDRIRTAYSLGRIDPKLAEDYLAAYGEDYKFNPRAFERGERSSGGSGGGGSRSGMKTPFFNEQLNDWQWVDKTDYDGQEELLRNGYIPGLAPRRAPVSDIQQLEEWLSGKNSDPVKTQKSVVDEVLQKHGKGVSIQYDEVQDPRYPNDPTKKFRLPRN